MANSWVNSSRVFLEALAERAAASIPNESVVLDAGAGNGPYVGHFSDHAVMTCDVGIPANPNDPFVQCDLAALPYRADSLDLVFCTQVLEHVPNPVQCLQEFRRVLRPGGSVWLTVPFFFTEHMIPNDYFRFTQFGVQQILDDAGFVIDSVEWLEGYFGTLSYQLQLAAKSLRQLIRAKELTGPSRRLAREFVEVAVEYRNRFATQDLKTKPVTAGMPINYVAIARKPTPAPTDLDHWQDLGNYRDDWSYRTKEMSKFISPNTSVVEFGAGRRLLEGLLPNGCTYRPSDLASRGPDTFVCDLNARPLPVFPEADVAVLSGVLEYVDDLDTLARHLSWSYETVILSYVSSGHVAPADRNRRWRHALRLDQVVSHFVSAGFGLREVRDIETQAIVVLRRQRTT